MGGWIERDHISLFSDVFLSSLPVPSTTLMELKAMITVRNGAESYPRFVVAIDR